MAFVDVNNHLKSLPANTTSIDLSSWDLDVVPDLSRFTSLESLDLSRNNIRSISGLHNTIMFFRCDNGCIETIEYPQNQALNIK